MLDPVIEKKMDVIAERIFGTQHDPDQIPITKESGEKLEKLTSSWVKYRLDKNGDPISWVIFVPTTKEIANKFIKGEITERQVLDMTVPQEDYSALYFCAAVTIPEYRRKGLAIELVKEVIHDIPTTSDYLLFAWPYSKEGRSLIEKLEQVLERQIYLRSS